MGDALATVNGSKVGSVGWTQLVDHKQPEDPTGWSDEEKRKYLEELIDEEVLFQEAFARGVYQDPKVRRILLNLLLREQIYERVNAVEFTDQELQAHYEANKDDYIIPEKVQIKRIFVAVAGQERAAEAAKALIDAAYAKVKADPASFRDVATTTSEDPFARRGGDIGFLERAGRAGVPPMVVERAFALEEGGMTEPFEDGGGWNIVYVPARRERVERSFDTMKGSIQRRMRNERFEAEAKAFTESLRAKAAITIDEAAVKAFSPQLPQKPGAMLRPDGMAPAQKFAEPPPGYDGPSEEEMQEAAPRAEE